MSAQRESITHMTEKTDDDHALFRKAMQAVKPLKNTDKIPQKKMKNAGNIAYRQQQAQLNAPSLRTALSISLQYGPDDILAYAKTGLSATQYQRLKKGQYPIDASIDLHGYTLDQALLALESFFDIAYNMRYKCLRIIHGKGSDNKPLLKNAVLAFLEAQSTILAFHSAPPKMGGAGVLLVLITSP